MNFLLTVISILFWVFSSYISNLFYPSNSLHDIEGYWSLKKILYSVSILFILLSKHYKTNKKSDFFNIIFIGVIVEDITDRFIFNVNQFEYNDITMIELTIFFAFLSTNKNKIYDFLNKIYNFNISNNDRNKKF
jgi:hypothetical protein